MAFRFQGPRAPFPASTTCPRLSLPQKQDQHLVRRPSLATALVPVAGTIRLYLFSFANPGKHNRRANKLHMHITWRPTRPIDTMMPRRAVFHRPPSCQRCYLCSCFESGCRRHTIVLLTQPRTLHISEQVQ